MNVGKSTYDFFYILFIVIFCKTLENDVLKSDSGLKIVRLDYFNSKRF